MSRIKYNLIFIASAILVVVLITTMTLSNRKGTYSLEGDPTIAIECSTPVKNNSQVVCNINMSNPSGYNIMSVNANYDINSDIVVPTNVQNQNDIVFANASTCTGSNCFNVLTSTNNGFATVNTNGITGNAPVGTITFTIQGTANNSYTIGLKNIELCKKVNDDYVMITAANVSTQVRIKNNVATLNNITLDKQTVDESFDSGSKEYTATIADNHQATDTVSLVLTPTANSGATIQGTYQNLELHYGTNNYSITVQAEDGTTTQTYNISIYREFDFTPYKEGYIYNSTDNYIYIKNEPIKNENDVYFSANLGLLPANMQYEPIEEQNILKVKYDNEVLQNINILRFDSVYQIIDNNIYIDSNLTLGTLKNKFSSNSVTFKYYKNNSQITNNSTTISNGNYSIKVYYNDTVLLDSYNIVIDSLTFDNSLIVDDNKKMIKRISIGKTYGQLKALINTTGTISLTTGTDIVTDDNYTLRTGDTLSISLLNSTQTYTISVLGCLDDAPAVTLPDVIVVYRHTKNALSKPLTESQLAASDFNNDGTIDLGDVIIIYRYFKGVRDSLEVSQ